MKIVVRNVIMSEGRFLMGLRSDSPHWELFGGKVEKYEYVKCAGCREQFEETKIYLEEEPICVGYFDGSNSHVVFLYWKKWSGNVNIGPEHRSHGWFPLSEVVTLGAITRSTEYFFKNLLPVYQGILV